VTEWVGELNERLLAVTDITMERQSKEAEKRKQGYKMR